MVSDSPGTVGTSDDASSALTLVSDAGRREESELESAESGMSDSAAVKVRLSLSAGAGADVGDAKAEMMGKGTEGQEPPAQGKEKQQVHNGSSRTTVKMLVGNEWVEQEIFDIIPLLRDMKFTKPGK